MKIGRTEPDSGATRVRRPQSRKRSDQAHIRRAPPRRESVRSAPASPPRKQRCGPFTGSSSASRTTATRNFGYRGVSSRSSGEWTPRSVGPNETISRSGVLLQKESALQARVDCTHLRLRRERAARRPSRSPSAAPNRGSASNPVAVRGAPRRRPPARRPTLTICIT